MAHTASPLRSHTTQLDSHLARARARGGGSPNGAVPWSPSRPLPQPPQPPEQQHQARSEGDMSGGGDHAQQEQQQPHHHQQGASKHLQHPEAAADPPPSLLSVAAAAHTIYRAVSRRVSPLLHSLLSTLELGATGLEVQSRAYTSAKRQYSAALLSRLAAAFASLPDPDARHWYAWSVALLEAREELAPADAYAPAAAHRRRPPLTIVNRGAAAVAGAAALVHAGTSGRRSALWSVLGVALAAELAAGGAARKRVLDAARADARALAAALDALAAAAGALLTTAAAAARMVRCAQVTAMGLRLAVPLPPVARMEAAAVARSGGGALQLPALRAALAHVLAHLAIHVARSADAATAAAAALAAARRRRQRPRATSPRPSTQQQRQLSPAPQRSPPSAPLSPSPDPLLLASLADTEALLVEELHALVLATARALAADCDVAALARAVGGAAAALRSGADRLTSALDGGDDGEGTAAGAAPLPPQARALATAVGGLRLSCETALTALYTAQVALSDAGGAGGEAPAERFGTAATRLQEAAGAWSARQVEALGEAAVMAAELASSPAFQQARAAPSPSPPPPAGDVSSSQLLGDSWVVSAPAPTTAAQQHLGSEHSRSPPASAALYSLYEHGDDADAVTRVTAAAAVPTPLTAAEPGFTDVLVAVGAPDPASPPHASVNRSSGRRPRVVSGASADNPLLAAVTAAAAAAGGRASPPPAQTREELLGELSFALTARAGALPPARVKGLPGAPMPPPDAADAALTLGGSAEPPAAAVEAPPSPMRSLVSGLIGELRGRLGGGGSGSGAGSDAGSGDGGGGESYVVWSEEAGGDGGQQRW